MLAEPGEYERAGRGNELVPKSLVAKILKDITKVSRQVVSFKSFWINDLRLKKS